MICHDYIPTLKKLKANIALEGWDIRLAAMLDYNQTWSQETETTVQLFRDPLPASGEHVVALKNQDIDKLIQASVSVFETIQDVSNFKRTGYDIVVNIVNIMFSC